MKRIRLVLLLLLLPALGFAFLALWAYRDLHTPQTHNMSADFIEIERGSSPAEIVSRLVGAGVLRHSWPVIAYLKLTGSSAKLKAGEYRFPSPITPLEVLRKLETGEERFRKFTVIEGWTRFEIAAAMARIPELKQQSEAEALSLMNDTSAIRDLDPQAHNLEGYLYPDTYNFPLDVSAHEIISVLVKRFQQEWKPEWTARAAALNLTPREIVTIAALIETEAKLPEERPLIASVIYNRLRRQMALGIDSSVIYASKLAGKWKNDGKVYKSDIERNSPYNTRINTGLPPGPIASPSASSLNAALFPAETGYLYYVREPSRDDGAHNFYVDEAGFNKGVQALREWERQRDARAASKNSNPTATSR